MKKNFSQNIKTLFVCTSNLRFIKCALFLFLLVQSLSLFAQKGTKEVIQTAVLKGIWFTDSNTGYAVGYNGTILKTVDAGISWQPLNSGITTSLFSVSFSNAATGIACGANGVILKTADAGLTWQVRQSGSVVTLHEVFFLDSVTAYISGQFGTYLKTTDAGETWSSITLTPGSAAEKSTPVLDAGNVAGDQAKQAITLHNINQVKNKDSLVSVNINILEDFWKKYNYLSTRKPQYENVSVVPDLYKVKITDTIHRSDYLNHVNEAKIKQAKRDIGLSIAGTYQENSSAGVGTDEMIIYRRRASAGLDWDVLGNGYLSSRYKQQILKNEMIINSLKPEKIISAADYIVISHKIIYAFNQHKIKLLEQRQQIINDKIDAANELYLLKHLPKLELMQIIQQQVDVTSMFQIYKAYNEQLNEEINADNIPVNILPVFDLDPEKITGISSTAAVSDSIVKLKIKNLEIENSVWNDINLKTQLRYNYYNYSGLNQSDRSFLSAGLLFSVPLPFGTKADKNAIAAQADLMRFDQKNSSEQQSVDMLNTVYEFRYKLKQYNNFMEKHKKYEELLRIERVKEKLQYFEFNPISALNLLDEMLSIEVEMLDLQQEMYLSLLDIITKSPGTEAISIIQPLATAQAKDNVKSQEASSLVDETKDKSMYIWSESLSKRSEAYIEEYLNLNNINRAIISAGQVEKAKVNSLFSVLKASGIQTELMIGSNKLLFNKNPAAYLDSVTASINLGDISALHLDVEPHVLDDWEKNKDSHLALYVNLVKQAQVWCSAKNLKLNVSIPVFYPEATLAEIYPACDKVYLMAYEHTDAFFILKKVKEEFAISAEKTVIALRAKDFATRSAFEKFLNELGLAANTKSFAMHDLETFIKLDELSSGENDK
ncbi:MAG: YCF48-related protein [Bacteroidia bacterium]